MKFMQLNALDGELDKEERRDAIDKINYYYDEIKAITGQEPAQPPIPDGYSIYAFTYKEKLEYWEKLYHEVVIEDLLLGNSETKYS